MRGQDTSCWVQNLGVLAYLEASAKSLLAGSALAIL